MNLLRYIGIIIYYLPLEHISNTTQLVADFDEDIGGDGDDEMSQGTQVQVGDCWIYVLEANNI